MSTVYDDVANEAYADWRAERPHPEAPDVGPDWRPVTCPRCETDHWDGFYDGCPDCGYDILGEGGYR